MRYRAHIFALVAMSLLSFLLGCSQSGPKLVEGGLAACVSILPGLTSVYRWQGKVETATEVPLLIKTTRAAYTHLETTLRAHHPYELPEIIAVPVITGFPGYLQWVAQETQPPASGNT